MDVDVVKDVGLVVAYETPALDPSVVKVLAPVAPVARRQGQTLSTLSFCAKVSEFKQS
jgi:hypothetical protein